MIRCVKNQSMPVNIAVQSNAKTGEIINKKKKKKKSKSKSKEEESEIEEDNDIPLVDNNCRSRIIAQELKILNEGDENNIKNVNCRQCHECIRIRYLEENSNFTQISETSQISQDSNNIQPTQLSNLTNSSNSQNSTNSQLVAPHNNKNSKFANLSQIVINCCPKIEIYQSINNVLSVKNKFQIDDGVLFWHFNRWQPMYGCCKILNISLQTINSHETKLFTIGTKDNVEICQVEENRICWYPNWSNDNIVLLQNVHIDASQKLNVQNKKWDGHSLCLCHSRNYIPNKNILQHQNSKTKAKSLCLHQNVLYSIDGNPFLCSQTLTDLQTESTNLDWDYPPKYVKWICEKLGRDFEIDYPKKYEFLRATEKAFDFRPQLSTNVIELEDSDESENESKNKKNDSSERESDENSVTDSLFVSDE